MIVVPFHDGLVVWQEQTRALHCLNVTAAFVWNALRQNVSIERIVVELNREFESHAAQIASDVENIYRDFFKFGLIDQTARLHLETNKGSSHDPELQECRHEHIHFRYCISALVSDFTVELQTNDINVFESLALTLNITALSEARKTPNTIHIVREGTNRFTICADGIVKFENIVKEAITAHVSQTLTNAALNQDNILLSLHGGIVQSDFCSALITGESHSGKSTLIAGLVEHGFRFSHDDAVPVAFTHGEIADNLMALPIRTPACLKHGSLPLLPTLTPYFHVDNGLRASNEQVVFLSPNNKEYRIQGSIKIPELVIFPRFFYQAKLSVHALTPVETMQNLLGSQTQISTKLNESFLRLFLKQFEYVKGYIIEYSEIEDVSNFLLDIEKSKT